MKEKLIKTTDGGLLKFTKTTAVTSKVVADALGVRHSDLMRIVKKAEEYLQSHYAELRSENLNFNAVFQDYTYENDRGRTYKCKLMNEDAASLMIKMTDTPEATNYFIRLKSNFNNMKMEREVREDAKLEQRPMTDAIKILDEMLHDLNSGSAGRMYTTINKQIRKHIGLPKKETLEQLTAYQANELAELRHNVDTQIMHMIDNDYDARTIRDNIKAFLTPEKYSEKKRENYRKKNNTKETLVNWLQEKKTSA